MLLAALRSLLFYFLVIFSGFAGHSSIFALFYAENLCCSLTVLFSRDLSSPPTIYSVFP